MLLAARNGRAPEEGLLCTGKIVGGACNCELSKMTAQRFSRRLRNTSAPFCHARLSGARL